MTQPTQVRAGQDDVEIESRNEQSDAFAVCCCDTRISRVRLRVVYRQHWARPAGRHTRHTPDGQSKGQSHEFCTALLVLLS